jgi:hypothetical protein
VTALVHSLLAFALAAADETPIHSVSPTYDLTIPSGYQQVTPRERPPRYVRPRGRESWELVSMLVVDSTAVLRQNLDGVQAEDFVSRVPFPPDAKWTFHPLRWKDFDTGSFEFRAVVKDMPVFGCAVVLPLLDGSVTIVAYAPETLQTECREELQGILARVTKAPSPWRSPEHFQKVRSMNRVSLGGVVLLLLYPIAWAVFFRDDPLRAHWLRTAWLVAVALLLFIPITSPGETTLINNLLLNAVMPVVLLLFAARRIKMGIELS